MNALFELQRTQPVTHAILVLCLVSMGGLILGKVRYKGIGLGTAGTLFAGLACGQAGLRLAGEVLEFAKDFGLILFVFAIGLRLGPGFAASLRQQGIRFNLLTVAIGATGAVMVAALAFGLGAVGPGLRPTAAVGVFCGATTNTPALGAVEQTLAGQAAVTDEDKSFLTLAYAVSYPLGVAGLILSLLLLKWWFRVEPEQEARALSLEQERNAPRPERRTLAVDNRHLAGMKIAELPGLAELGITVSRIRPAGQLEVLAVDSATTVQYGDLILAVGTPAHLDRFQRIVGERSDQDLFTAPGNVTSRRVIVTKRHVLGQSLAQLDLTGRLSVTVTRVVRSEVEVPALAALRVQFGDVLHLVGEAEDIAKAEQELGNSTKALHETQFLPLFAGIAVGILVGLIPIAIPGLPQPVRLGLAGGPLVIAIIVSRAGHLGPLVWYMPRSANLAFSELGITMFLASVGLGAGERFLPTVMTANGLLWMGIGVVVNMVPLLVWGAVARRYWRVNYATLSGVLAGSLTDPPALAFASNLCRSDAPALGYATVYPIAMLLRIALAQTLLAVLGSGAG